MNYVSDDLADEFYTRYDVEIERERLREEREYLESWRVQLEDKEKWLTAWEEQLRIARKNGRLR